LRIGDTLRKADEVNLVQTRKIIRPVVSNLQLIPRLAHRADAQDQGPGFRDRRQFNLEINQEARTGPCKINLAPISEIQKVYDSPLMHSNYHPYQHSTDSNWVRFCPRCGGKLEERFIEFEQRLRKVCSSCGFIFYLNPKVVAAAVPCQHGRIWLLRRNIEPGAGRWTFPGGYVDLGERVPDAAIRETREETCLEIQLDELLNVYSYNEVGVVLVVYRATVTGGVASVTLESQEVRAFAHAEIPWNDLAFPSTREALRDFIGRFNDRLIGSSGR